MITIEQLLESVDLDFEPRWVTKDESGLITIWADKPSKDFANNMWVEQTEFVVLPRIKLADFADKPWQECIYEVPRWGNPDGQILKLQEDSYYNVHLDVLKKINELVVAVNRHADIIRQIGQWGSSKGEFLWCETLTKFEPDELKGAKNE